MMGRAADRPTLEPDSDLAVARATLIAFRPADEEQERIRDRIVAWVDEHPTDAHLRSCLAGHLTAAVLLVDADRERVLLHHHRKLDRWLQFGGHCDGDANLFGTAWRELIEESGIEPAWMSPLPIDLDVHPIPARPGEPAHDHLDVRYVAIAPAGATGVCSSESRELRWFGPDELPEVQIGASLARLITVSRRRIETL